MRSPLVPLLLLLPVLAGCSQRPIERVEWTTMGTVAAVQWKADGHDYRPAVETVKGIFAQVETLLNAHDPESELSRLAAEDDATVLARCDRLVRPCYEAAFRLRDETGGVFNPRWRGPKTMDLGAIAKGFAVDLAVAALTNLPASAEVLVDLGGNLKCVCGTWSTAIESQDLQPSTFNLQRSTFNLQPSFACATSGEYYRGHHIKDGRTGGDIASTAYSVTVVHPDSAMLADGLSTVLFILGRERGEVFLKRAYPTARAIWLR